MSAADEDFTEGLSAAELKALSARLERLANHIASRQMAKDAGFPLLESCVVFLRSVFQKTGGEGKHGSHTKIRTARAFARIGGLPVIFWVRATEVVEAEAEFVAFKLTSVAGGDAEGDLLYPPAPYEPPADGDGDTDILLMPLADMQALKERCGLAADPRPANEWLRAVLRALSDAMAERHKAQVGEGVFENIEEVLGEHFDPKYIPSKVMTVTDMLKEKGMI